MYPFIVCGLDPGNLDRSDLDDAATRIPPPLSPSQALCSRAHNHQAPLVRQATGVSRDRFMQLVHVMSKVEGLGADAL